MKALTIRQPWAGLIVAGLKTVENRSWPTSYRGVLVIHAGARPDDEAMAEYGHLLDEYPAGAIIGTVQVVDCVRDSDSPWAIPGQWHWLLTDPRPCKPRAAKGSLGLWTPDARTWAWVRRTRRSRSAA